MKPREFWIRCREAMPYRAQTEAPRERFEGETIIHVREVLPATECEADAGRERIAMLEAELKAFHDIPEQEYATPLEHSLLVENRQQRERLTKAGIRHVQACKERDEAIALLVEYEQCLGAYGSAIGDLFGQDETFYTTRERAQALLARARGEGSDGC